MEQMRKKVNAKETRCSSGFLFAYSKVEKGIEAIPIMDRSYTQKGYKLSLIGIQATPNRDTSYTLKGYKLYPKGIQAIPYRDTSYTQ
jgi:hypothetical protein